CPLLVLVRNQPLAQSGWPCQAATPVVGAAGALLQAGVQLLQGIHFEATAMAQVLQTFDGSAGTRYGGKESQSSLQRIGANHAGIRDGIATFFDGVDYQ